jgi:hypothetical protein
VSGTPGFTGQFQLGGFGAAKKDYILCLFCDWKTIWSLKYRPIDGSQRYEIDKIVQVRKYRLLVFQIYSRVAPQLAAFKVLKTKIT